MKKNALKQELKQLNVADLLTQSKTLQAELFNLKINSATAHVKDYSQFKKLRKNIARSLTFLRQSKSV